MNKVIVAYVPVLHDGYRKFFAKHSDAGAIYILGEGLIDEADYLKKNIQALDPALIQKALESWNLGIKTEILDAQNITHLQKSKTSIIMPDEDVCHAVREKYFKDSEVFFDSIFLRWDKHNSVAEKPVSPDTVISHDAFDKKVMHDALTEAEKSSDFWRHVGAALVKDGEVIRIVHNQHVPSDHMPYAFSDPRNAFKKGINIDISTVLHAEARIIAEAAAEGLSLKGTSMYVTTFPCPTCAKLIAYSGIKNLYAGGGYAVLDGESILKARGVKIIFVESDQKEGQGKKWKGYKK